MSRQAWTFPGQGSQAVGMGQELAARYPEARAVFEEVDSALNAKLSTIMFEGPEEALRLTENAQPALMAVSLAVVRVLQSQGVLLAEHASYVAGHSLGEYSALCAAGAFTISDAARLLRTRGQAMQRAVPVGHGAMAALLGLDLGTALQVAEEASEGEVCEVANDNAPGQVVISGHTQAVERAAALAKTRGAKRAVMLLVSAPFHCSLMRPAADAMQHALSEVAVSVPVVPIVSNVLASPISDPEEIRRRLVEQVTGRVRWSESVTWISGEGGVKHLLEVGAGKVLTGLVKRINPDATAVAIGTPADIESFMSSLASPS